MEQSVNASNRNNSSNNNNSINPAVASYENLLGVLFGFFENVDKSYDDAKLWSTKLLECVGRIAAQPEPHRTQLSQVATSFLYTTIAKKSNQITNTAKENIAKALQLLSDNNLLAMYRPAVTALWHDTFVYEGKLVLPVNKPLLNTAESRSNERMLKWDFTFGEFNRGTNESNPIKFALVAHAVHYYIMVRKILQEDGSIHIKGNLHKDYVGPKLFWCGVIPEPTEQQGGSSPVFDRTESPYGTIVLEFDWPKLLQKYKNERCCSKPDFYCLGTRKYTREYSHAVLVTADKFFGLATVDINNDSQICFTKPAGSDGMSDISTDDNNNNNNSSSINTNINSAQLKDAKNLNSFFWFWDVRRTSDNMFDHPEFVFDLGDVPWAFAAEEGCLKINFAHHTSKCIPTNHIRNFKPSDSCYSTREQGMANFVEEVVKRFQTNPPKESFAKNFRKLFDDSVWGKMVDAFKSKYPNSIPAFEVLFAPVLMTQEATDGDMSASPVDDSTSLEQRISAFKKKLNPECAAEFEQLLLSLVTEKAHKKRTKSATEE